jgi:hypothetical protein
LRRTAAKGEGGPVTARVARVFLDLGVTMTAYNTKEDDEGREFHRLVRAQFETDPAGYRDRIVGLIRRAHEAGAEVVVLPGWAMMHRARGVTLASYAVPEVPLVVSGACREHGFVVVMRHGVVAEQLDASGVRWLDGGRFTVMTAISSTIGNLKLGLKHVEPAPSTVNPPGANKPVLVLDVGHAQYGARYLAQTLRCVARDVRVRVGQPGVVVLSSWMWSTRGIGTGWWWADGAVVGKTERVVGGKGDWVDLVEVGFGGVR